MARVLVISDTQAPFHHPRAIRHLVKVYKKYRCNKVVHIGDEADFKFLKYSSINDPDTARRQHELTLDFMFELYKWFPNVKVCHSNHVKDRIEFAASQGNIPDFMLRPISDILQAPRHWEWAEEWVIDNVRYTHGHKYRGIHPQWSALNHSWHSIVMGHHPRMGISYKMVNNQMFFGMCVGALTLSDLEKHRMAYGMRYSKKYPTEMPLGCGVVIDGKPYLEILED